MKVLIACEFSGIVREAFKAKGHDATSCDYLDTEIPGQHYKGDVKDLLKAPYKYDLMICHPPCKYLAVSGARWFKDRRQQQIDALKFIWYLLEAKVVRICLENPVGIISTAIRKPSQIIQPYEYGHEETKKTCLWLQNLPKLEPTKIMEVRNNNLTPSGQNKLGPSPDRWKDRSRTYKGIAQAMAEQWSNI